MAENKPLQPKTKTQMEKELMRCEKCGKPFIKVTEKIGGMKPGNTYKPDCEHYPKNARFSVG